MSALSFKGQFVPLVKAGLKRKPGGKRQTIRNYRKRGPLKVGETLYLYFAQRSEWCKKLGEAVLKSVQDIVISETGVVIYDRLADGKLKCSQIWDITTGLPGLNRFAKADGFKDWETMKRWWKMTHGPDALPFTGNLYKW